MRFDQIFDLPSIDSKYIPRPSLYFFLLYPHNNLYTKSFDFHTYTSYFHNVHKLISYFFPLNTLQTPQHSFQVVFVPTYGYALGIIQPPISLSASIRTAPAISLYCLPKMRQKIKKTSCRRMKSKYRKSCCVRTKRNEIFWKCNY